MNVTNNPEALVGKTLASCWVRQFAQRIMLATQDGTTILFTQEDDGTGDKEVHIYHPAKAHKMIMDDIGMRKELYNRGVITDEEINEHNEDEEIKRQRWLKEQEERQKQEQYNRYQQLKKEFE